MDFVTFTKDARLVIKKLETYGLSCLYPSVKIGDNDIEIYPEPVDWRGKRSWATIMLKSDTKWIFQLNLIKPGNSRINIERGDIFIGCIVFPSYYKNKSKVYPGTNIMINIGQYYAKSFVPHPFEFIPAINNTYFINDAFQDIQPTITFVLPGSGFDEPNYDIFYLVALLRSPERKYCLQQPLIKISTDHDLTINKPNLYKLPFDKNEFITVTHHPDRVINWCMDIEQQSQWKKI